MARRIGKDQIARAKQVPTTGDGYRHTQKPKPQETKNVPAFGGFVARLIRRSSGGKHQGRG